MFILHAYHRYSHQRILSHMKDVADERASGQCQDLLRAHPGPLSFKLLTGTIASIPRLEELYCTVDTKEELRGEWFEAWSDLYFNLQSSIRKFEAYLVTNSFGKSLVAGGEDGDVYQEASEELVVSRRQGPLQHLTDLELPHPEDWTTTEEVKKALLWSPNATD